MDKKWGRSGTSAWFIFMLIIVTVVGDGEPYIAQNIQEKPPFGKLVMDTLISLKKSHKNSWEKVKAIVHGFQLQFFPPDLDFRVKVKEAAEKSFEVSKTTAEESAAKVVGEAVHQVKDKLATDEEFHQHDEL